MAEIADELRKLAKPTKVLASVGPNGVVYRTDRHPNERLLKRAANALDAKDKRIAELEAERDGLLDKLDTRISMHHDIEEALDDTLAALREIAWSRPLGPTRSKAVERLERIAIDALGAASSLPNKEDRNG